jgi:hypothetical protein
MDDLLKIAATLDEFFLVGSFGLGLLALGAGIALLRASDPDTFAIVLGIGCLIAAGAFSLEDSLPIWS